MTESGAYAPPPPAPHVPYASASPVGRRSMAARHLASAAIALVVTPVGILLFDYGASEYSRTRAYFEAEGSGSAAELVLMLAGGVVLLAVATTGRLSGLGPILAGFAWAVIPLLWYVIDLANFYSVTQDLPSTHFWFPSPPYLFGLVSALLVGSGLAGRWRGAQL